MTKEQRKKLVTDGDIILRGIPPRYDVFGSVRYRRAIKEYINLILLLKPKHFPLIMPELLFEPGACSEESKAYDKIYRESLVVHMK